MPKKSCGYTFLYKDPKDKDMMFHVICGESKIDGNAIFCPKCK